MTSPNARDAHEYVDQLRLAMEDDDANLFKPLQAALANLVMVGLSLEVLTCHLTRRTIYLNVNTQSNRSTKYGFIVLENRLPDFEVVATASASESESDAVTVADNEHLQRLLHATGV